MKIKFESEEKNMSKEMEERKTDDLLTDKNEQEHFKAIVKSFKAYR